jgi:antitoxin HigA-1
MLTTTRKPATIGEILTQEFIEPMGLTQGGARGSNEGRSQARQRTVQRPQDVTAPTALILARVFGNSLEFWLNMQRRTDLWEAMHSASERKRIERARPLKNVA